MISFNAVPQIKWSLLLFFTLYLIIFASISAAEDNNEEVLHQHYQSIRNNSSISPQEKKPLYAQLLQKVMILDNNIFQALIINQLHYSSILQADKINAQGWLERYKITLNSINSEQSLLALNILLKKKSIS